MISSRIDQPYPDLQQHGWRRVLPALVVIAFLASLILGVMYGLKFIASMLAGMSGV